MHLAIHSMGLTNAIVIIIYTNSFYNQEIPGRVMIKSN